MSKEISDQLKIAEQALTKALDLMSEIPGEEKAGTTRHWIQRLRAVKQDVENLKRMGIVVDLLYSRKRRLR